MKDPLYFEKIGDNFDGWMSSYDVERRIKLISKLLPANAKELNCLEIGCGTGRISEYLHQAVGHLTVLDVSSELAGTVGERLSVPWLGGDACHLSIPDNSYDLIVSSECIEHVPDPKQALMEMARVIRPGGQAVITSPNRLWYPVLVLSLKLGLRHFDGNENWLFPWTARKVLQAGGLSQFQTGGCHLLPWQLPGAKKVLPLFERYDKWLYPLMINYGISGKKI